jgi:hypothetical protein
MNEWQPIENGSEGRRRSPIAGREGLEWHGLRSGRLLRGRARDMVGGEHPLDGCNWRRASSSYPLDASSPSPRRLKASVGVVDTGGDCL